MGFTTPGRRRRAFTLVEMLLAITIAVAMLVVALLFYRQAADLRNQILLESERLATLRLLSDRMEGDLHLLVAMPGPGQEFRGDTGTMSFVRVGSPGGPPGPEGREGDRVRVTYTAVRAHDGTNLTVLGLDRQEQPLAAPRAGLTRPTFPLGSTFSATNTPTTTTNLQAEPLTELVRHLHFRYWNGAAWVDGWTNSTPPPGVEIVLGVDPQPAEAEADDSEYPGERFRRVVFVPAGLHHRPPPGLELSPSSPP